MSFCEFCDRSTIQLCDMNACRACCKHNHANIECDKYDGEWKMDKRQRTYNYDDDDDDDS